ncbi:MAG: aminotransferase class I/II-fold pyridoxal phosphate-dependent enzyme [Cyclobacteriaceae bacterium]|nr:aminotransferase class I/II-fold pyridoxal phosphate-dependent enzyme [Cyclobacteriaceae bacterium]
MSNQKKYKIYLSPPWQSGDELLAVQKALESNWLAPGGPYVAMFEDELKRLTGRKHCLAVNSGTSAIHLALKALGVGPGDYVICQSFCFVALANPIVYLGAIPVFIDIERDTWNMDPNLLEDALKELTGNGIRPKAVLYAHIYGNPAKVHELQKVADRYEVPLLEDAAEALGSTINGNSVGVHGKISIFSFNGNKIVTSSGGGALLTDDDAIAEVVQILASQAKDPANSALHVDIGYNYKLSNICAALGFSQLQTLSKRVEGKHAIFRFYQQANEELNILRWTRDQAGAVSNRWISAFLLPDEETVSKLVTQFENEGIEVRRFWKPMHSMSIYHPQRSFVNGVSEDLFARGICLPSGLGLKSAELGLIKGLIKSIH